MARLISLPLICVLWTFIASVDLIRADDADVCFYPGGITALDQQPCSTAFNSQCCPENWTCFSDHRCVVTTDDMPFAVGQAMRGGCTEGTWNNTVCGDYCTGYGDSGMLLSCGLDVYCCQSAAVAKTCDCDTGEGTFAILAGRAEAVIEPSGPVSTSIPADGVGSPSGTVNKAAVAPTSTASLQQAVDLTISSKSFLPGTNSLADQSTPPADSTNVSTSGITSSTGDITLTTSTTDNSISAAPDSPNTSTGTPSTPTSSSAGSKSTSTTSTSNSPAFTGMTAPVATIAASSSSNNKALKIGLGVGLPLFFLLLGCAAFLFFRRRRSNPYQSYPSSHEKTPLQGPPSPTLRPKSAFHPIPEYRPTSTFAPSGPLSSSPVTGDTFRTSGTTLVTSATVPKAGGHHSSTYSAHKPYNKSRASRAETFRDSATFAGSEIFSPSSPRMATAVPILRLNQESIPRVDNYRISAEGDEELVSPVSEGGRSGRSRLSAVSGVTVADDGLGISSSARNAGTSAAHERNGSNGSSISNISNSSNNAAPAPTIPRKPPLARQSTATMSGGSPSSTGSPGEILGTGNVRHESARVVNAFSLPYEGT